MKINSVIITNINNIEWLIIDKQLLEIDLKSKQLYLNLTKFGETHKLLLEYIYNYNISINDIAYLTVYATSKTRIDESKADGKLNSAFAGETYIINPAINESSITYNNALFSYCFDYKEYYRYINKFGVQINYWIKYNTYINNASYVTVNYFIIFEYHEDLAALYLQYK